MNEWNELSVLRVNLSFFPCCSCVSTVVLLVVWYVNTRHGLTEIGGHVAAASNLDGVDGGVGNVDVVVNGNLMLIR